MSPLKGTEREFALDGVKNARDLGGIPLPGGGTTAFGRFLRTDAPFMLRECGRAKLLKAGFDRALDLRSDGEAGSRPTCLSADGRFAVCRSPLAGNGRIPATRDEVPETYLEMVRGQAQMRRALAFLADAPRGAVIHCTACKDRTGVVCALLLANAGVGVEEIAADYARTQQRMGGVLERVAGRIRRCASTRWRPGRRTCCGFGRCFWMNMGMWSVILKELDWRRRESLGFERSCGGEDDPSAPPRERGGGRRVYGFLDGNRGVLGVFWVLRRSPHPLTAHRTSRSGCSGVPHGLFSMNSPLDCSFRNAHASGLRPSEGRQLPLKGKPFGSVPAYFVYKKEALRGFSFCFRGCGG